MPASDDDNSQYLYLVLTGGGTPNIDFDKVSEALELKKGATTKRWSRMKIAMKDGKSPGATAYPFLWLCLKHSTRDKAIDWEKIAKACNTTPGAASKRYSRLKIAFEKGEAAPTPVKSKAGPERAAGPAKRKRDPVGKDAGSDEEDVKPKRARATKKGNTKAKAQSKTKVDSQAADDESGATDEGDVDACHNAELMDQLMDAVKAAGGDLGDLEEEEVHGGLKQEPGQEDPFFGAVGVNVEGELV